MTDLEKAKKAIEQRDVWLNGNEALAINFTYSSEGVVITFADKKGNVFGGDIKNVTLIPPGQIEPKPVNGQRCMYRKFGSANKTYLYYKNSKRPALESDVCFWDELDHEAIKENKSERLKILDEVEAELMEIFRGGEITLPEDLYTKIKELREG